MDVKFITVRKSNLNAVPVVDGQVLALEDANGMYYDMNSNRYPVSSVRTGSEISGVGYDGELFVLYGNDNPGIYFWDSVQKAYVLIANKDTDTYLSVVKNASLEKAYILGYNGEEGSKDVQWNDNVYANLSEGTVTAKEFVGKATDSYKSDHAKTSDEANNAKLAEVASKIGTQTTGDPFTAVYILNGVPSTCSHYVKSDVPENAKFTDTTYTVFSGASESLNGTEGLVLAPLSSDREKFLKGDGTWSEVVIPSMTGCTSDTDGSSGLVPTPSKGKYNSFLKGDGTWASYAAGYGLELVSLTFNLEDSGVTPGSYGPMPNAEEMTVYSGDYIPVPRITVDKYGRVTNVQEVKCYVKGSSVAPEPDASLMYFTMTPDNKNLLCTYEDMETALAEFDVDGNGHLNAEYQYDPTPATVEINHEGHAVAIPVNSNNMEATEEQLDD